MLSASKAATLVTTVGFLGTDTVGMLRAAETPLPHLRRIVLLEGSASATEAPKGADVEHWHAFAARGEGITAAAASERRQSVRPTDTSDVLFTSGTTGRPKGVVMTHGQTVRQFREWCEFAGLRPGDRYLIVNPFFHMFGYKAGWLASLLQGATIVPVPVFDVPDRTVPGGDGAHHGAARRPDDLPLDPRPSRARSVRSPARCGWRSPGRPTSPSR